MKILFTMLSVALSFTCFSQQKPRNTYYLDSLGREIKTTDSILSLKPSDFIRVIQEEEPGAYYSLIEYYYDRKIKRIGSASSFKPLKLEGYVTEYYPSGKRKSVSEYEKNEPVRSVYEYYPNGQLKTQSEYLDRDAKSKFKSPTKLISFFDSTGVQKVKDGNGTMLETSDDLTLSGKYTEGLKDSIWTGVSTKGYTYIEKYDRGLFISGVFKENGVETSYTAAEQQPEYPGGISKFQEFVGRNYVYPFEASKMGVSGRVIVQFVIEKDGSLVDLKILRHLGYGTGEEALRVISKSPKWKPGRRHGKPVRVLYTLPIALSAPRQ